MLGSGEDSWGYGDRPADSTSSTRFSRRCAGGSLDNPLMFGDRYTQLTDVFQEQNGIFRFDSAG